MGSVGRRLSGYKQKALGRQTLKFAFDVVPISVADVPTQYGKVSFVLQRGGALQYTDAVNVDTERKAYWNEVLKLTATTYKVSNKMLPKEYVVKVQSATSNDINGKRTTFGKAALNLAEYCTLEPSASREVTVQLRPYGAVRLNIRTTWIHNASPDKDAMTEGSYMSSLGRQSLASTAVGTDSLDQIDQDLEGFDDDGRGRTPISEVASRHRSPFKQRRNSGTLGPGPLGSGPPAYARTPQGSAEPSGTRQHTAATAQLHTASTAPQLGQQPPAMISPFMYAAAPTADSTGTSRADPTTSPLEQGRRQGSATLQSAGSIPNQSTEDEDDDVFLSPGLPLKPLRKNGNRHRRSQSSPLNLPVDIPEVSSGDEVGSPASQARNHDKLIKDSHAILLSSDDDDESAGLVAGAKRWWGSSAKVKQPPRPDPNESPYGRPDPALQSATNLIQSSDQDYEAVMRETDVQALQQRCRQLLRQRDADRLARRQDMHRLERLEAQVESLGRAKGMMAERLAVSEAKLMKLHHDEVIKSLVEIKMELAQSRFEALELQGQLKEEQGKSRCLLSRLSAVEAQHQAAMSAAHFDDLT
ncbi:hypothetical protein ABBQ38_014441 [Trebouxia sp. C0009 RCD-2024]